MTISTLTGGSFFGIPQSILGFRLSKNRRLETGGKNSGQK
jgi:hypothetical protein